MEENQIRPFYLRCSYSLSYRIWLQWVPEALSGANRPYHSFTEAEQTIIDNEIEKFLLKGIIRLSLYEDGQVISPIFVRPKKDGSHRVIFNLKKLNEAVSYHHFKMDTFGNRHQAHETWVLHDLYWPQGYILFHPYCTRTPEVYLKFIWKDQLTHGFV